MREIYPHLHIGNETDYVFNVKLLSGWRVVHACKEPYHRAALGYTERGAPKGHPEYLVARRGDRLMLNLINAPTPAFVPAEIIDAALAFLHEGLRAGQPVLVHSTEGVSRAPSLGLLYLAVHTNLLPTESFLAAEQAFHARYRPYAPAPGLRGYLREHWHRYMARRQ